jgi:hypothetical protein
VQGKNSVKCSSVLSTVSGEISVAGERKRKVVGEERREGRAFSIEQDKAKKDIEGKQTWNAQH